MRCGMAERQRFEDCAHFGDLLRLVGPEPRDPDAAPGFAFDQPLRFELTEGFAHRHMAGAEFLGNVILTQPLPGVDPAGDDALGQSAGDAGGDRFGFGCAHIL